VTRRKSARSQLYRAARDLGDLQAIEKGPTAYGRRLVRKKAYAKPTGCSGTCCGTSGCEGGRSP
jgi:hypothetical protein